MSGEAKPKPPKAAKPAKQRPQSGAVRAARMAFDRRLVPWIPLATLAIRVLHYFIVLLKQTQSEKVHFRKAEVQLV